MGINREDLTELKRIFTNAYAEDKACINRIIRGINDYQNEIRLLKVEVENLKIQLASTQTPPSVISA